MLFDGEFGELRRGERRGRRTKRAAARRSRSRPDLSQRHESVLARDVGEVETRDPRHGGQSLVAGAAQRFGQRRDGRGLGRPVETADPDVDRMDRPSSDGCHHQVARALDVEPALDRAGVAFGQFDRVGAAEEVRRVQQVDVQRVALDPLAAVEEATKRR